MATMPPVAHSMCENSVLLSAMQHYHMKTLKTEQAPSARRSYALIPFPNQLCLADKPQTVLWRPKVKATTTR
jgi:hypothetical protein